MEDHATFNGGSRDLRTSRMYGIVRSDYFRYHIAQNVLGRQRESNDNGSESKISESKISRVVGKNRKAATNLKVGANEREGSEGVEVRGKAGEPVRRGEGGGRGSARLFFAGSQSAAAGPPTSAPKLPYLHRGACRPALPASPGLSAGTTWPGPARSGPVPRTRSAR